MRMRRDRSNISALEGRAPLDLLASWRSDHPLVMLHSGRVHHRWARWTIMACPTAWYRFEGGRSHWIGAAPGAASTLGFAHDPVRDVDAILMATRMEEMAAPESALPFRGGWIGCFSYDLGKVIEPAAQATRAPHTTSEWPLIELAYCPHALVFDHLHQQWHAVGADALMAPANAWADDRGDFALGPLTPCIDRDRYVSMAARTIEYIAAGDIFQANIAQRFAAPFEGCTRALAAAAFARAQPWYGAYLEFPDQAPGEPARTLVSLSPELFLSSNPRTRRITTRPIKGTRPASRDVNELIHSEKDQAELHMIVDLMRNDLGRVCEFGSVQVPVPRQIESHPTVHHGVAEVTGRLRENVSFGDLLRATFPGGSVTGAPKIRAMQIIDELEPASRGPYCGAIGFLSNCGAITLNIAIRTLLLEGVRQFGDGAKLRGTIFYSAGAGIVADSNPRAEYRETLDKTAAVRAIVDSRLAMLAAGVAT